MGSKRGRVDKGTFKQILRDHWEEFKGAYPRYNTLYYDRVIRKMLECGDPEKAGYAVYLCAHCGEMRKVAFSCKSSFCLSCAKVYTDEWASFVGRRLFPAVAYRHVVLTVPEELRVWFYRNPNLLSPLMKAGHECLVETVSLVKRERLELGSIVVLQTAGRSGGYNPHLHILLTSGGLNAGGEWVGYGYLHYEILHKKWQYYLLSMLRQEVKDPKIKEDIDRCWKKYKKGLVAWIEKGKVPEGGKGLAEYLARYVVSPPISVRRIEEYDGERITYWYNDHKTGARKRETVGALKFIGRMVQHILPKGFQRIRYYGLHASCKYEQVRAHLEEILPGKSVNQPDTYRVVPRERFQERFFSAFGEDPIKCGRCGERMELWKIWAPGYGVIFDRWKEIFREDINVRGDDRVGTRYARFGQDTEVQLSMSFMPVSV